VPELHGKFRVNLNAVKILHTPHTPSHCMLWHAFSLLCFLLELRVSQALESERGQGKTSSCCDNGCCLLPSVAFSCGLVLVWHVGRLPLPGIV